ncbi:MAG: hypothetical protein NTX45_19675 [Proteobacteria bacterium]|nr:hypothetical protein [Pseudomonadota bacterium]
MHLHRAIFPIDILSAEVRKVVTLDPQQTRGDVLEMKNFIAHFERDMAAAGTVLAGIDIEELDVRDGGGRNRRKSKGDGQENRPAGRPRTWATHPPTA